MHKVYENKTFIILSDSLVRNKHTNCILLNKRKKFSQGHTHISNFGAAMWLIHLSQKCEIPKKISPYMIESLIRVNTQKQYIKRLRQLLYQKAQERGECNIEH